MSVPLDLLDLFPLTCKLGYTREQVEQITAEKIADFDHWMRGQTVAICGTEEYEPCSGGHGLVTYSWDVANWLQGGQIRD